jgi:hypothetical protein
MGGVGSSEGVSWHVASLGPNPEPFFFAFLRNESVIY